MGYQKDQSFVGETYHPGVQAPSQNPHGPPLPPRASPLLSPVFQTPPPYENIVDGYHSQPLTHSWTGQDPRERSTESLLPPTGDIDGRRTLLLIYIHGFLGNETSFQSFPAHIHNILVSKLVESHVVHTKIYPRYKSRKAIEYARDDFSNWLCPHESPSTDVILLGHSLGGILSAEVALLPPFNAANREPFRHRILGTISFDTPFLGMHPGVIVSGIGSLFMPKPASPKGMSEVGTMNGNALLPLSPRATTPHGVQASGTQLRFPQSQTAQDSGYFAQGQLYPASLAATPPLSPRSHLATPIDDPNYDPPFPNDVRIPIRKGWDSTLHFIMKHSDGLTKATKSYITSHLEFGGCLADYRGLKLRYDRIRALEDVDDSSTPSSQAYRSPRRIRFVNYYSASTGYDRKPKQPHTPERARDGNQMDGASQGLDQEMQDMSLGTASIRSASRSPRISVEDPRGDVVAEILPDPDEHGNINTGYDGATSVHSQEMNFLEPGSITDDEEQSTTSANESKSIRAEAFSRTTPDLLTTTIKKPLAMDTTSLTPSLPFSTAPPLPPLPPRPTSPAAFDPTPYIDKDTRKLAEKEHARQTKLYKQALKDRDRAIKDRRKLLEKREKTARQTREKAEKDDEMLRLKEEKVAAKRTAVAPLSQPTSNSTYVPVHDGDDSDNLDAGATRTNSSVHPSTRSTATNGSFQPEKKKRDRKFCVTPSRVNGERDPCWPRVFMVGVDEVAAHCGLFFADKPHYEGLVGDVAGRVEVWVREKWRPAV